MEIRKRGLRNAKSVLPLLLVSPMSYFTRISALGQGVFDSQRKDHLEKMIVKNGDPLAAWKVLLWHATEAPSTQPGGGAKTYEPL